MSDRVSEAAVVDMSLRVGVWGGGGATGATLYLETVGDAVHRENL